MIKGLVVIVVARSAWLWVCKSDLVVSGDGFTNWFWPGLGLCFSGGSWWHRCSGPWVVVARWVWG